MADIGLTEDQFDEQFGYVEAPDGGTFWNYEDAPEVLDKAAQEHRLWTAVDNDEGGTTLLSGWHYVNRFAYVVAARPFDPANTYYCDFERPDEECCSECGQDFDGQQVVQSPEDRYYCVPCLARLDKEV